MRNSLAPQSSQIAARAAVFVVDVLMYWDERKEALRKAKAMRISRLAKARHIEQKRLREIIREKKNKTSQ